MFIQTEATPNPATLKFLPGRVVMPEGTFEAKTPEQGEVSPLAERLFAVPGVTGVFFGYDFVTVTKADGEWQHLKPAILGAIMEHFMTGQPLFANGYGAQEEDGEEFFDPQDAATVGASSSSKNSSPSSPAGPPPSRMIGAPAMKCSMMAPRIAGLRCCHSTSALVTVMKS